MRLSLFADPIWVVIRSIPELHMKGRLKEQVKSHNATNSEDHLHCFSNDLSLLPQTTLTPLLSLSLHPLLTFPFFTPPLPLFSTLKCILHIPVLMSDHWPGTLTPIHSSWLLLDLLSVSGVLWFHFRIPASARLAFGPERAAGLGTCSTAQPAAGFTLVVCMCPRLESGHWGHDSKLQGRWWKEHSDGDTEITRWKCSILVVKVKEYDKFYRMKSVGMLTQGGIGGEVSTTQEQNVLHTQGTLC